MRKSVTLLLILGFLISSTTVTPLPVKADPKTIVVPDDYQTIQEAIGNATAGDTVFVKKGIYKENVIVDKSVSLLGEDSEETVIEGQVYGYGPFCTIRIQANNVEISGFTITGTLTGIATDGNPYGCKIIGNNIEDNFDTGIFSNGENADISGNNITDNHGYGIEFAEGCYNSTVHENNIMRNDVGVELLNFPLNGNASLIGSGNVVYRNNLVDNSQQAVVEKTWRYAKNFENYNGDNGTDIVSWDNGKEGNYWSDYSGQGEYLIGENNIDHHPLTQQIDISTTAPELSTTIVTIVVIVIVIAVSVGLLIYFKKRKH